MYQFLTEELLYQKSPQELTALLYEACQHQLEQARQAILQKQYIEANQALIKTNDILYRLGAGLNYEAGIIADQLEALYDYMAERVLQANLKKDISLIDEVLEILASIQEAWQIALQKKVDAQSPARKLTARAYDANSIYER